jgi:hypothetical protein
VSEAWLDGPIDGIAPVFQPAAHAFVQARSDVRQLLATLPADVLWREPGGGAAPAGFHLLHLANATDRLLTYARGEALSAEQASARRAEATAPAVLDGPALLAHVESALDRAMDQIRRTDPASAFEVRPVGRAGVPSTVLGLIFHAAEHATRHVGQCITTTKIVLGRSS